jgi:hypothetical protein
VRLVEVIDGALELRWTWLPYWLATNGRLKKELDEEIRAAALMNAALMSPEHLDGLHAFVCRRIQARFPQMLGLYDALKAISAVDDS